MPLLSYWCKTFESLNNFLFLSFACVMQEVWKTNSQFYQVLLPLCETEGLGVFQITRAVLQSTLVQLSWFLSVCRSLSALCRLGSELQCCSAPGFLTLYCLNSQITLDKKIVWFRIGVEERTRAQFTGCKGYENSTSSCMCLQGQRPLEDILCCKLPGFSQQRVSYMFLYWSKRIEHWQSNFVKKGHVSPCLWDLGTMFPQDSIHCAVCDLALLALKASLKH